MTISACTDKVQVPTVPEHLSMLILLFILCLKIYFSILLTFGVLGRAGEK